MKKFSTSPEQIETYQKTICLVNEPDNIQSKWIEIEDENGEKLEGKLYENPGAKAIIIFHPGAPGDGIVWFEENHVPALLKAGYSVFSARHNGLIINAENQKYVHAPEREHIGQLDRNRKVDVNTWLNEPALSLKHFSSSFEDIILITHSFSGLSASISLPSLVEQYGTDPTTPIRKLNKWLVLAGFTAQKRGEIWDPTRPMLNDNAFIDFYSSLNGKLYNFEPTDKMMAQLEVASSKTSKTLLTKIPSSVGVIGVYPPADTLVGAQSAQDLISNLGRGLLIQDNTFSFRIYPDQDAHDFPHLTSETLIRLLKLNIPPHSKSKVVKLNSIEQTE